MPSLLCIKHTRGPHLRGNVLQVWPTNHVWRPGENKAAWLADGRALADWSDIFFTIHMTVADDAKVTAIMQARLHKIQTITEVIPDTLATGGFKIKETEVLRREYYFAVD